ncbi:MAG: pyrimidine-nucleoside phosphorylase, partial [Caldilineaceae bacterium]|nr:pyrimidine-nucleoside phosphorylase [Caldilineaceae bacterium]
PRTGALAAIDTSEIGWACARLGGGRMSKSDQIDHAVGFILPAKIGDSFQAGEPLGVIHANDPDKLNQARAEILAALTWSDTPVDPLPHIYDVIT